jgi:hypothetical protein
MTTITRRSRNIGFSWTNSVRDTPHGWEIHEPSDTPEITGTPATVLAHYRKVARDNGTTYWRGKFFVGGVPVDEDTRDFAQRLADLVEMPEHFASINV